ncbi:hypothetical protein Q9233_002286 [Columba guinea]|nr:hypothetical protein Q9233_002286 [Columba guinea]
MHHLPCGKDEFHKYTWKKVTWIDLSTLALPVGSNSGDPLVADMGSAINRHNEGTAKGKSSIKWRRTTAGTRSLEDSNMCHSIHHKSGAGLTREEEDLQSTKLHDLAEEHNKAHVIVCTTSEGENIPVTPHGGSDALESPQPGELSDTRPLLQDRSHTDEAEGRRVSESHCAANWYLFHMCLPIEGKQQPQRLIDTLTEDGLDLWGIIPSKGSRFQKIHKFPSRIPLPWGPVCGALVSCHSLVVLDKKIQADLLDLKMFEATHLQKNIPMENPRLVPPVPANFLKELESYTSQGFRVITLAHGTLNLGKDVDLSNSSLGWKEGEFAVCSSLLLERAGTKCRVLLYRHFSPEDQTLSPTSPWGNGTSSGAQSTVLSYEDTTLWPLSSINSIIVASTFSKGKTFWKPIYTDCIFSVLLALQLAICLLLFFADTDAVYGGIQVMPKSRGFNMLLCMAAGQEQEAESLCACSFTLKLFN